MCYSRASSTTFYAEASTFITNSHILGSSLDPASLTVQSDLWFIWGVTGEFDEASKLSTIESYINNVLNASVTDEDFLTDSIDHTYTLGSGFSSGGTPAIAT